jgi:hypothetical protein
MREAQVLMQFPREAREQQASGPFDCAANELQ